MTSTDHAWRLEFARLAAELRAAFRAWGERPDPWPESRVSELACRAFGLQWRANRPYRLYCERLGKGPDDVSDWRDVPPVPTAAFREVPLCVGPHEEAEAVFRTSGTTRGHGRRGSHPVRDLGLYRAALEAGFRRQLLAGAGPVRILSLIPPYSAAGDSSLSWMADAVMDRFGTDDSMSVAGAGEVRWEEAHAAARDTCRDGEPLCILATTLAADAWTRWLEAHGAGFALPPGSLLMDTGGAKGRPGLERRAVLEAVQERLGIQRKAVVNEFGMTELLSQRYSRAPGARDGDPDPSHGDPRLPAGDPDRAEGDPDRPSLHAPPWLRTRALDPVHLSELPEGELGVLCHLDLANAGSVCAVLTEDLGRVAGNVLEFEGRAAGAPPRGCSLATAELLAAQGGQAPDV